MPPPHTAHGVAQEDDEDDTADDDDDAAAMDCEDAGSDAILSNLLSQSIFLTVVPFSIDDTAAATANPATDANGCSPDMICTAINSDSEENQLYTTFGKVD